VKFVNHKLICLTQETLRLGKFINHTLIPNAKYPNIGLKVVQIKENTGNTEL